MVTEFTLKVFIYGLIGIVPLGDGSHKLLLLKSHDTHVPVLAAAAGSCAEGSNPCQLASNIVWENKNDCWGSLVSSWLLHGDHVSLEIDGSIEGPQKVKMDKGGVLRMFTSKVMPATKRIARSCTWAADLAKARGGDGIIKAECVADQPCDDVVATMQVTRGDLRTAELARAPHQDSHSSDPVVAIAFAPTAPAAYQQALTEALVLEIPVRGRGIRVWRRKFSEASGRSIYLTPSQHCKGRPCVELYLANDPQCVGGGKHLNLGHFSAYYELLATPGPKPAPIAVTAVNMPWNKTGLKEQRPDLVRCFPKLLRDDIGCPLDVSNKAVCPPAIYEEPSP